MIAITALIITFSIPGRNFDRRSQGCRRVLGTLGHRELVETFLENRGAISGTGRNFFANACDRLFPARRRCRARRSHAAENDRYPQQQVP